MPQPTCPECSHPRPDRHTSKCTFGLKLLFAIIDDRLPDVTWQKQRAQLGEGGGAGGFESCPPINVHNWSMLSWDSGMYPEAPDDYGTPMPVEKVLAYWRDRAAGAGGSHRDGPWVIHQPWIGDMVADLRRLAGQIKSATGEPPPRPIGKCRRLIGLGAEDLVVCGEPLYFPEGQSTPLRGTVTVWDCPTVRCPRPNCREEYTGSALLRLKLIADQEARQRRSHLVTGYEGPKQRMAGPDPVYTGKLYYRPADDPDAPWTPLGDISAKGEA